ncbi:Tubulin/FtsZ family, GTPase domain-containing protein [Tribonema minus]|uniref:Tubulin/FtsZ family, GTPase domain-containing protein n=1 Tax=Tribonema minus TaxID=303371 RepID=A0A835YXS9_9STRA|nr:Tubulin/FtsZ family, GTPase domain-containing protein [Tribonema minus]
MPRELITIQVGQCGNQIGRCFWQQALAEHASAAAALGGRATSATYDDCMSSFFRNVDPRSGRDLGVGTPLAALKARAVLVDMEDGVVNETLNGPLGELFDQRQLVTDVYGAGNNWAHGYAAYGPQYGDALLEAVRAAAEKCESLQSFFLMHSMGGGTGSGLGTYLLSLLEDSFPEVLRMVTAVFPSQDDDVVTSPYNAVLALRHLTDHADCAMPVDNQSLLSIAAATATAAAASSIADRGRRSSTGALSSSASSGPGFDGMNSIVASLMADVTASARFPGSLNVDLNEIATNLVPFPRMHYLVSALSPLRVPPPPQQMARRASLPAPERGPRGTMPRLIADALSPTRQLMRCDPARSRFLACSLLLRGDVTVSEANVGVEKLRGSLDMVHWNREGFKVGLCNVPPPGLQRSLLCLSNNCCVAQSFEDLRQQFCKLYTRRAMVHHYTQFVDQSVFDEALESVTALIADYEELNTAPAPAHKQWAEPAF